MTHRFTRDGGRLTREFVIDGRTSASYLNVDMATDDPLGDWWTAHLRGQRPTPLVTRRPVRTVDLFSGPGGLAVGFSGAALELGHDFVSVAAADQDAEALLLYTANHSTRLRCDKSVSSIVDHQVAGSGQRARFVYRPEMVEPRWLDLAGRVDVVLAGPPCQGHSNLNNRTRRTDRRNELYLTVPAIAVALGADMVVIENVPAVVHDRREVVQSAVQLLRDDGYFVETGVLSAAKLGWPQNRQRFILVARKDVPPVPLVEVEACLKEMPRSIMWAIDDLVDAPFDGELHLDTELSDENRRRINYLFENDLYDLPPSERPECHRNGTTYNAVYGRLYADRPSPTITTGFMTPGRGRYIHPSRRRTLTPREAARIQGFPDTYRFCMDPSTPPSKYKLGKWLGDAVPMPLGHAAGLSVLGAGEGW
jgi:DNA (cytosine-5)-methyltransferase 1